jgi:hypothetical protein
MINNYHMYLALLWSHIVTVLGALGALFTADRLAAADIRSGAATASRICSTLLVLGFIAGLVAYLTRDHSSTFHMAVGLKMILILVTGAGVGIASARERRNASGAVPRRIGLAALVAASLIGMFLRTL